MVVEGVRLVPVGELPGVLMCEWCLVSCLLITSDPESKTVVNVIDDNLLFLIAWCVIVGIVCASVGMRVGEVEEVPGALSLSACHHNAAHRPRSQRCHANNCVLDHINNQIYQL